MTRRYPEDVDEVAISAAELTGEIVISGRPSAYARLAEDIEAGWRGSRLLSRPPQATGHPPLEQLEIVETAVPRITFRAVSDTLVVSGSSSALSLLARNLWRVWDQSSE